MLSFFIAYTGFSSSFHEMKMSFEEIYNTPREQPLHISPSSDILKRPRLATRIPENIRLKPLTLRLTVQSTTADIYSTIQNCCVFLLKEDMVYYVQPCNEQCKKFIQVFPDYRSYGLITGESQHLQRHLCRTYFKQNTIGKP